jgi:hypothetical protein
LIDSVINGVCIGLVALAGIGASIALLYIIGAKQGKW